MKKDGFLRCYLEASAYWIGGNAILAAVESITAALGLSENPLSLNLIDRLVRLFEPTFLMASGIMIVPLFAAILVGNRRATGTSNV